MTDENKENITENITETVPSVAPTSSKEEIKETNNNKNSEDIIKYDNKREEIKEKICDNNLTISTKLSTDQLICKSTENSPNLSDRSTSRKEDQRIAVTQQNNNNKSKKKFHLKCLNLTLYLGVLQILFGLLMSAFGVLAIMHGASLSQIGGGLWGGCLAVATGTLGVLTAARDCCPLKRTAQHVAHTVFLALSLISLAVSQLVMVLSATGLSRDLEKSSSENNIFSEEITTLSPMTNEATSKYTAALTNVGLLVASALECICAAVASYKGARAICPCFSNDEEQLKYDYYPSNSKYAFINSWLGKHNPPPFYVVAAPPTLSRHSKISSGINPIYSLPPPPPASLIAPSSLIGYPLIPGALGPLGHHMSPAPMKPRQREYLHQQIKVYPRNKPSPDAYKKRQRSRSKSRSKSKERPVTTEEVAKTYTGLDRAIAEEFIDMCESRNNSLCSSESSCQSCCQCSSQTTCQLCNTGSDVNSRDYLVDNK